MEYFVAKGGERQGPYTRGQVEQMLARGEIGASDHVWTAGQADWVRIDAHPDFSSQPPPPPAAGMPAGSVTDTSLRSLYEAVLGPDKAPYYLPRFEQFDGGGSKATWNWPAAFLTAWWMLYRGMFLWGLLLLPLLCVGVLLLMTLLGAALFGREGSGIAMLVYFPLRFILVGSFGNLIYHRHVRKMIDRSATYGFSPQQRREWLIRKGGTNFIWILVIFFFLVPAIIGILAAIAIPAYQDYVIRSQVMEGAMLADGTKAAIADYYQRSGSLPADNAAAGLAQASSISGLYVSSVTVSADGIDVKYGKGANRAIQGQVLHYAASADAGAVHFRCNTGETTIANKYLPTVCRHRP